MRESAKTFADLVVLQSPLCKRFTLVAVSKLLAAYSHAMLASDS